MKKALTAGVALIALTTGMAAAADLPGAPAPVYVAPMFTWTGFYIGGNIGAAWADNDWNDTLFTLSWPSSNTTRFIGGGQAGFNYQIGGVVLGVEGDFDWIATHNANNAIAGPNGDSLQITSNNTSVATVAARFGYASDRVLIYGKAGGGWVGNGGFTLTDQTTGQSVSGANSNTRTGWLAGIGTEWAVTNNWTVKIEYDYVGVNSQSYTLTGAGIPALAGDTFNGGGGNVQMVKFGINYLFNWSNPVVASY
jgi:outer membrane immunogenic protein